MDSIVKLSPEPLFLLSDGRLVFGFAKEAPLGFHFEHEGKSYDVALCFQWRTEGIEYWPVTEAQHAATVHCSECGLSDLGYLDDYICFKCREIEVVK